MSKKMIQINPKYMSVSKNNKQQKKKKQTTIKNTKFSNSGAMRNKLLNKIKDFQKKTEEQTDINKSKDSDNENFSNEFNKSLLFLQNLSNSKKKSTKKNKKGLNSTEKGEIGSGTAGSGTAGSGAADSVGTAGSSGAEGSGTTINTSTISIPEFKINTDLPSELMEKTNFKLPSSNTTLKNNEPIYGCLKNGTKPTYREWKRKTQSQIPNALPNALPDVELNDREKTLHEIKQRFKQTTNENHITDNNNSRYQHQIKTTKYKLGKDKTKKAISILIKNSDTRKKINIECDRLRKKSIIDVKNYLRKRNLLKAGSDAPQDVLRSMYENAVLTGEVNNESKDTLLHNFYNN